MKAIYKPHSSKLFFRPSLIFIIVAMISLMFSACNLGTSPATLDANALSTIVYQTADARMTQVAFQTLIVQVTQAAQPSATQSINTSPTPLSPTATGVPPTQTTTPTQAFTATPVPPTATNTPKPSPADWAQFVTDVTVPDGTTFAVGASFTKTWRLKNIGSTTWTKDYALVYVSDESMGAQKVINLTGDVARGAQVDLSAAMVAPATPGNYQGSWMLRNASGKLFGIGAAADKTFWVKIVVVKSENIAYNFVSNFCASGVTWVNESSATALPCPGAAGSTDGSVQKVDNPTLEDSSIASNSALRVEPQRITNGVVKGIYPAFSVISGDHFKTTISCARNADCHILFALHLKVGSGPEQSLGSWAEVNDHLIRKIDVDLSSLAGQNVVFILMISSKSADPQNIGLWLNPRIVR